MIIYVTASYFMKYKNDDGTEPCPILANKYKQLALLG